MQTRKKYIKVIYIVSFFLIICIGFLSVLLYTHGPRVRNIHFEKDTQSSALFSNSIILITFDRPIQNKDYSSQISFYPNVNFETTTSTQSISIKLKDNFLHNTEYTLKIGPDIFDSTGKKMESSHVHTFTTGSSRYAFLERNYGLNNSADLFDANQDSSDFSKIGTVRGEQEIIFEDPEISIFSANNTYVVASVRRSDQDVLFAINLKTKQKNEITLPYQGRIRELSISSRNNIAVFTLSPEETTDPDTYDEYSHRVFSVQLASNNVVPLKDNDMYLRAFYVTIDPYGQSILLKNREGNYYAASPFNDYEPILIGSHTSSYGFNEMSSEIIFRNNDRFSLYTIATSDVVSKRIETNDYIKDFQATSSGYFYSRIKYDPNTTISYIDMLPEWNQDMTQTIWEIPKNSDDVLDNFSVSYDTTLVGVELSRPSCVLDGFVVNRQCIDATLSIFDTTTNETLHTIRGSNIVWIP